VPICRKGLVDSCLTVAQIDGHELTIGLFEHVSGAGHPCACGCELEQVVEGFALSRIECAEHLLLDLC
jgi:hypothetical protein